MGPRRAPSSWRRRAVVESPRGEGGAAPVGRGGRSAPVAGAQVVATMRTYLAQVACVLRTGSVGGADLALRSFTTYLAAEHPALQRVRDVGRPQVEGFKTWVAARPGQNKARVTPATI